MSAKSCQLCGKPLSRLRVGGDGDFCSREHRNQHRLRAGMDRLEEANKVTSLMRRRENPRHISAERLMCNSALDRRGFFEPQQRERRLEDVSFSVKLRGPALIGSLVPISRLTSRMVRSWKATAVAFARDPINISLPGASWKMLGMIRSP